MRPMTIAATGGTGSKLRSRLCLDARERERTKIDYLARRRLEEVITHDEPYCAPCLPLPMVEVTTYDQDETVEYDLVDLGLDDFFDPNEPEQGDVVDLHKADDFASESF